MSMFPDQIRAAGWLNYDSPFNEAGLEPEEIDTIRDRVEGYLTGYDTNDPLYGVHLHLGIWVTDGGYYDYQKYNTQHRIIKIEDILLGSPTTSTHASWRQS